MYLDSADLGISSDLLLDGIREVLHTETVRNEIKEGDIIVDIGANIGYYALQESKLVGDKGRVYAIEPVPENFDLLSRNITLNGYSNIVAYNLAIGNEIGTVTMNFDPNHRNLSSVKTVNVHPMKGRDIPITTLDDFLKDKPNPNVIRMDVEGFERNIIKGMEKTLDKNLPLTLLIEIHFGNTESPAFKAETITMLQTLKDAGFKITDGAFERWAKIRSNHRILCKLWRFFEKRRAGSTPPSGHLIFSIDEIMANATILNDDWGELEACFKRI